jgi:hypothetical protein
MCIVFLTRLVDERTYFQLTLDNGTHCVTTSWLDMARSTPIGQEFELTVQDDPLEFQFTLQTKLEPPRQQPPQLPTAAAAAPVIQKKSSGSTFRNLLVSSKKRKDNERKAQEEADRLALQRQQEAQAAAKRNQKATAWDLLHDLVGQDGSFARAYVCLNNYEDAAYGRPLIVDIPCFNEWAVDDSGVSSVKSKRGGVVRRPPYRVGKLEIQLLYVPIPKGAGGDDMPKSMNACIRELKEAEEVKDKTWEGHLSQQGGDCPVSVSLINHHHQLLTTPVLAPSLLPFERHKTYRLPRDDTAAACYHQPCQGNQAARRQECTQTAVGYQVWWSSQVGLCRGRGRLHVR